MIVVADATPIHYLVLIEEIDLLSKLYGAVFVPAAVIDELSHPSTPEIGRTWITRPPQWIIRAVTPDGNRLPFPELGLGERQALWLAQSKAQSILLTDDQDACLAAEELHIPVLRTLRLLSIGEEIDLIDLESALKRLMETSFRVSDKVLKTLRRERN